MTRDRLLSLALASAIVLSPIATLQPASAAPSAAATLRADADVRGLFGSQDPTYDGVLRQATAVAGLVATQTPVPARARNWLLRQQCPNGAFTSYRPNPSRPCPRANPDAYSGPDTNATAAAIMALRALAGRTSRDQAKVLRTAASRASAWLRQQQGAGGGWPWIPGLTSDAVSTGMALSALGKRQRNVWNAGYRWLTSRTDAASGCELRFQAGAGLDPLATAWAGIGVLGRLPFGSARGTTPARCEDPARTRGSLGWLRTTLVSGQGRIASAYDPASTDWNVTALATIAMARAEGGGRAERLGLAALRANVTSYVSDGEADVAGALGTLLMVARSTRSSATDFGGVNLRARLLASLQG